MFIKLSFISFASVAKAYATKVNLFSAVGFITQVPSEIDIVTN